jgi:hypothetical protein
MRKTLPSKPMQQTVLAATRMGDRSQMVLRTLLCWPSPSRQAGALLVFAAALRRRYTERFQLQLAVTVFHQLVRADGAPPHPSLQAHHCSRSGG